MTVRLLVDLLFYTGTRGGTETYARQILERIPDALPDAQFVAIANRAGADRVREFFPGNVRVVRWVGADRVSWAVGEATSVNRLARRLDADVLWSPANFAPITRSPVPRVTTTHDVTYHTADARGPARVVAQITSWLMSRSALTSDRVITGSRAAEESIVSHIGVDRAVITVVPHGTTTPPPPADPWPELAGLGIHPGRAILLSTGNRLPHKNFEGILRAVATMGSDRPLVVVPGSHGQDPLAALVRQLGLEADVVLPGWVTAVQLEALFAAASLYVCPSLAEGFGLPIIDAMGRGCVVLANDVPVLREVGGDVALYADATDPVALADAIIAALADDQTQRRRDGLRRAAEFTWDRSAERTARVVEAASRSRTTR